MVHFKYQQFQQLKDCLQNRSCSTNSSINFNISSVKMEFAVCLTKKTMSLVSSIGMYAADAGKDTDAITEQLDDLRLQLSTFSADFAAKYALLLPQINDAVRLLRIDFVFL